MVRDETGCQHNLPKATQKPSSYKINTANSQGFTASTSAKETTVHKDTF
jgi:hypothetical protein